MKEIKELTLIFVKLLSRASGASGSEFLAATGTVAGNFRSVLVNTDLVIDSITSSDPKMQTFVGETISAGALITVAEGHSITSITSTSGDAILYR